ncbi:MAG: UDP-N-acetyl-D-glucosamine 2-epimerase, UDP-hydrolysing [Gammaproteobacteria bacterium RIFCSPHIGHO2_12_FULL_37_14]|nr:MAG: UDP-N-acetyl-D-glucosamine 2-epimerase, UDP-hydrolysing [Gammaproteobacteria bacterium RIFCSPHIGHO2_12_FULL_37_14]
MIKKRKIAVVTGTRAEYGLLYFLMREIQDDPELELHVIVTNMHLSPEFGLTYKLIEQDGFKISAKVEMLVSSDTAIGTAKSMGLGIIGFADAFAQISPDMIVLLGDRFESLAAAQTALVQKIPLAHIHGGELSEGAIDDAIRHSITKMSHLHFVAAEPYRKRVIQLGENPGNIFNVGAPGLERITKMNLLSRDKLEKEIGFKLGELNFIVTYLPSTLEINVNAKILQSLFEALDYFDDARIIFTKANSDEAGRFINSKIDEYVSHNSHRAAAYITLGDLNYLSLLQYVDVAIGNSSSGLIEVPYFQKPTVNIGNRQLNRLRASSVIDCPEGDAAAIINAIKKSLSSDFKQGLKEVTLPYRLDKTASKIKEVIKNVDFEKILIKQFNNLDM